MRHEKQLGVSVYVCVSGNTQIPFSQNERCEQFETKHGSLLNNVDDEIKLYFRNWNYWEKRQKNEHFPDRRTLSNGIKPHDAKIYYEITFLWIMNFKSDHFTSYKMENCYSWYY